MELQVLKSLYAPELGIDKENIHWIEYVNEYSMFDKLVMIVIQVCLMKFRISFIYFYWCVNLLMRQKSITISIVIAWVKWVIVSL